MGSTFRTDRHAVRLAVYCVFVLLPVDAAVGQDTGTPTIAISKSPASQSVPMGCEAVFNIEVTAPGASRVDDIAVSDPMEPSCEVSGQTLGAQQPSLSYSCTTPPLDADLVNVASVSGLFDGEIPVTAVSEDATVAVLNPAVAITKTPAFQEVDIADHAVWTITVTNTGAVPLTQISVVDDPWAGECSKDAAFFEGQDDDFQPGESVTYTCHSGVVAPGSGPASGSSLEFVTTATVTASASCPTPTTSPTGGTATASATATVKGLRSAIDVEKATNGIDADLPPGPTLAVGDPVQWTYVVTNNGETSLVDIELDDIDPSTDLWTPVTCPRDSLDVGETMTCTAEGSVIAGPYVNQGLVRAAIRSRQLRVSATDLSHYTGTRDPCFSTPSGITGCIANGGSGCYVSSAVDVDPSSLGVEPPTGLTFPHGLVGLTAVACDEGSTVDFELVYPMALPADSEYWKFGRTPDNPTEHWYMLPAVISGNTVKFSITDGALGDNDLASNGTIEDPSGPAVPAPVVPLPRWILLALVGVLLLAGGAMLFSRD